MVLAMFLLPACVATAYEERDKPVATLTQPRPGTFFPVQLGRTLRAGKTKPGTEVVARTTQRIPVGEHLFLPRGTQIHGQVVVSEAGDGTPVHSSVLAIRFTAVTYLHQTVPIRARAVAAANFVDVAETFAPATDPSDRGNPSPANWTTQQVGGDQVCRSGWVGPVSNAVMKVVGFADFNGVYSLAKDGTPNDSDPLPLALGVFSASAQGLYGFAEGSTLSSKDGLVTVRGAGKSLALYGNDNLLLAVTVSR